MISGSSPTRARRTRAEIEAIRGAMAGILAEGHPMTVRQVFYRMTTTGLIDKTEMEYKRTVGRLLADMRLAGEIPFYWIADNTRTMRRAATWDSVEAAIERAAEVYRRDLWADQPDYVEVWLEKEALAGIVWDVVQQWNVPLMVTRGYASLSFLFEAGAVINQVRKPTFIYHLGDYDPSGVNIGENIERRLRDFAPDARIFFERIAVTPEQIEMWDLPTRPTKSADTRSSRFGSRSVELDAIPANDLRQLVAETIEAHIDPRRKSVLEAAEKSEREILYRLARRIEVPS